MASNATLQKLAQAMDVKSELTKGVGNLKNVAIMGNRVLIAIYVAPEKTKSGLYRAAQTIREDIYQGVVGLVIKKGAQAFKDDAPSNTFFHGEEVKLGDWVVFRPGDARRVQLNGIDCRFVEDTLIDMVVDDPEVITHQS